MKLHHQLKLGLIDGPLTLILHKKKSIVALFSYLLVGMAVFSGFGYLLLDNQQAMKQALLDYLFPDSWHSISEQLFTFFFESQSKQVLGNAILSGSLVVASIFLFPIKEIYSAQFEKEQNYPNGIPKEFPLWMQGLEETRLFLFYLTAQMIILWIGYYPYTWANALSVTLSYLFLFYTFSLDIISPTLQRHRQKYSKINKLLTKNFMLSLLFGLVYSLPALLISQWILRQTDLNLLEVSLVLFLINLMFIAISIPAGTLLASQLLKEADQVAPVTRSTKQLGYTVMALLLIAGLTLHTRLIQSMHHKTQILKARYSVDWDSFEFDYKSLGELFTGNSYGSFSFDLEINNPTEFDLVFENSQFYITKQDILVSDIAFNGFAVASGETKVVNLAFDAKSSLSKVTFGSVGDVFNDWGVELHIQLFPGIPFIIQIAGEE